MSLQINQTLHLITYGCGDSFNFNLFKPIKNNFVKPSGGLWASPINSPFGWRQWCMAESFGDLSDSFTFRFQGNVFVIDSLKDAKEMPWYDPHGLSFIQWPDFEAMQEVGIHAIHITLQGERETRFSTPSLYGWDCESVLIMNPYYVEAREVRQ